MAKLTEHPKFIQDELNHLTTPDAIKAFRDGFKLFMNTEPSREALAIFVSHSALETGWWSKGLHRWNFGNTRCKPDKLKNGEYFTMFSCGEIINGIEVFYNPPHPGSIFQAFMSCEEGVKHYLKFLAFKDKYKQAWKQAVRGNPEQYIIELKKAGYFTAGLDRYKKTFLSIYNKVLSNIEEKKEFFTEEERKEVLDLIATRMALETLTYRGRNV